MILSIAHLPQDAQHGQPNSVYRSAIEGNGASSCATEKGMKRFSTRGEPYSASVERHYPFREVLSAKPIRSHNTLSTFSINRLRSLNARHVPH